MFAGMVGIVGRNVSIDGVRFEGMVSLGCWEVQSLYIGSNISPFV